MTRRCSTIENCSAHSPQGQAAREETYVAGFQSMRSDDELLKGRAMIWVVKAPAALVLSPGLLQQMYAADTLVAAGLAAPLTGQTNASIVLLDVTDARPVGGNSKKEEDDTVPLVTLLALKLRSTAT